MVLEAQCFKLSHLKWLLGGGEDAELLGPGDRFWEPEAQGELGGEGIKLPCGLSSMVQGPRGAG